MAILGLAACSNAPAGDGNGAGAEDAASGSTTARAGSGGRREAASATSGATPGVAGASGRSGDSTSEGSGGGRSADSGGVADAGSSTTTKRTTGASGGSGGTALGAGGTSIKGLGGGSTVGAGGRVGGQGGAAPSTGGNAAPKGGAGGVAGAGTSGTQTGGSAGGGSGDGGTGDKGVIETVDIGDVWSRHPTAFALFTQKDQQFAAFYDSERYMTVVQRTLGAATTGGGAVWKTKKLSPQVVQCDSHNYVTMAVDRDGYVHVSGNMHGNPLVYYRSKTPLDVSTLEAVTPMVAGGANEAQATYPQFFFDAKGDLIFAYRDGASGNGNYIFNKRNGSAGTWTRLLASPLINGTTDNLSAYPVGPVRGPDDWFHLVWVWRESADAETNKDLSYIKTQDFVNWKTAAGGALTLPITHSTAGIIVDPVPSKGGMINNNTKIGFDSQGRVILSYHKNDSKGTQLFNARREGQSWAIHQTSNWDWTWQFSGQGTLEFDIVVEPVQLQSNGNPIQNWFNRHYDGWGAFTLDPNTLAATSTIAPQLPYPSELDKPVSATAGMTVQWAEDAGSSPDPAVHYVMRWEALPSNRDKCPSTTPPATRLRLYGIR